MRSQNGWILPDGTYVECEYTKHEECAKTVLNSEEKTLEKTAVKVSINTRILGTSWNGKKYSPGFYTGRTRLTDAQLRTIERHCVTFRHRPPDRYFKETGFEDLANMSTEDILAILSK